MNSFFHSTDALISQALQLEAGQSLRHKTTCLNLKSSPEFSCRIENLVYELFVAVENNWQGRAPSAMNWKLRQQSSLSGHNQSPEILLERAIIILAERGLLKGWFNQLPIASGLIDEKSDKRAAVDLVRMHDEAGDLVELKWASDNPAYAAFEILRYGLAFLFCYLRRHDFGFDSYPLMQVKRLSLRVLAPQDYYSYCTLGFLGEAINAGLHRLFHEKTEGRINADFLFLAFPSDFTLPFTTGSEVAQLRELPEDAAPVASLIAAIQHSQPVWRGAKE